MSSVQSYKNSTDEEDNSLSLYLRDINNIPLIDQEKERALAVQARAGDMQARNELVTAHLRFVVNVAKKFQNRGLPLSDLISEGNVGLLNAIERFEPERGYHFISYAVWWIRQAILKALVEKPSGIRLPQNRVADLTQIQRVRKTMLADGVSDDPEQIGKILNLDPQIVRDLINISREQISLDAPVSNDNNRTWGQLIEDCYYEQPVENIDHQELHESIQSAFSLLSQKEVQILELRFGLNGEEAHSLKEVGEKLGLTKERIRQIEKASLGKLRHPSRSKRLMEFIA